jgi:D-alanine-D-alanine ligase-like ATP-grasp enzyme
MKKNGCEGCGPTPVIHWVERYSVMIGRLIDIFGKPFDIVWRVIAPLLPKKLHEYLFLPLIKLAVLIGIGKFLDAPDERANDRTRVIWEEAKRRGIVMREFRLFNRPLNAFVTRFKHTTLVFEGLPTPLGTVFPSSLDWMDDKSILKKKFLREKFPTPKGRACVTLWGARCVLKNIGAPLITKPSVGSRSRHTTIHINNEAELERGFRLASALSPWVVVEEELSGMVFRVTLIAQKFSAALRREPPFVTGDGVNTVRALLEKENARPERRGTIFHEIPVNDEAESDLRRQSLSWDAVPEKGRVVTLGTKIGRSSGGSNTNVTNIVHPENIKLFESIARFLNYPFIGIDFIIGDIAKPWQEQNKCGVIEVNSLPFIDLHHFPLAGDPINVASLVWDYAIPESRSGNGGIRAPESNLR